MAESEKPERIIWAKWSLEADGMVEIVATYQQEGEYRRWRHEYASLDEAAAELGVGFRDVVERSLEVDSRSGRWRP